MSAVEFYATVGVIVWACEIIGLALLTLLLAGSNALIAMLFWGWAKKIGFTAHNWRAVREWEANGRPEWKQVNGVFQQVPTAGPSKAAPK